MDEVTSISSEKELVDTFGKPDSTNFEFFYSVQSFLQYSSSLRVVRATNSGSVNAVSSGTAIRIKNTDHYLNGDGSTGLSTMVRFQSVSGQLEQQAHGVIVCQFTHAQAQTAYEEVNKTTTNDYFNQLLVILQ